LFSRRNVKRFLVCAAPVALVLALSACGLTLDSTELGVPTSLAEAATAPPQGTAFRITRHPVYLLWGAFGVGEPNLETLLAGQVGTGTRIANLRVHLRSRFSDVLVTLLTVGLIAPRSVTFEGVVVGP
jgi:hypothetical protein